MASTARVYSTVVFNASDRSAVERYLYGHTVPVHFVKGERGLDAFVLRTSVDRDDSWDADARAQYLAQYQADRLSSGLYGARVEQSEEAALDRAVKVTVGVVQTN